MIDNRNGPAEAGAEGGEAVGRDKRRAERLEEFTRRFGYCLCSFRFGHQTVAFNRSLDRLRRTIKLGRQSPGRGERVHPFLEIVISRRARNLATDRTGRPDAELTQADVEEAAAWAARSMSPIRGRPRAQLLDHHVAGLMALIEEYSGKAVIARRNDSSGNYDPRLIGTARILLHLKEVDRAITETQLVHKVCQVRRKHAGKRLRFSDFYPLYGARVGVNGEPVPAAPVRLEHFEQSVPIYCP